MFKTLRKTKEDDDNKHKQKLYTATVRGNIIIGQKKGKRKKDAHTHTHTKNCDSKR